MKRLCSRATEELLMPVLCRVRVVAMLVTTLG